MGWFDCGDDGAAEAAMYNAKQAAKVSKEGLEFARERAAKADADAEENKPYVQEGRELTLEIMRQQADTSRDLEAERKRQLARYLEKGVPAEDAYYDELDQVGSQGRQDDAAAQVAAGLTARFGIEDAGARRVMDSRGMGNSGAFAAMAHGGGIRKAALMAGAMNNARRAEADKRTAAMAAKAGMFNPNASLAAAQTGITAGNSGVQNAGMGANMMLPTLAAGNSQNGLVMQGYNGLSNSYMGAANMYNSQANQPSALGGLIGFGASMLGAPQGSIIGKWLS